MCLVKNNTKFFTKSEFVQELNNNPFKRFSESEILELCVEPFVSENFILFNCANNELGEWLSKPRNSDTFDTMFFQVFEGKRGKI